MPARRFTMTCMQPTQEYDHSRSDTAISFSLLCIQYQAADGHSMQNSTQRKPETGEQQRGNSADYTLN